MSKPTGPLTEKEWRELEVRLQIARSMDASWESTYVQIDAWTLMRLMKMAGWKPK